ncbi:MAG: interleukin-like EMT inducer domain-containing protein, partial [bacterium]
WTRLDSVGRHTFTVSLDPLNTISEVNELNNIASIDQYVYANLLAVVKPLLNMAVSPGQQRFIVTSPVGLDSVGFSYVFELDTVDTFNSPAFMSSGPISPGPVSGEWLTPSLPVGRVYFWRARAVYGQLLGRWVESSFIVSSDVPAPPLARWRENTQKQFRRDILNRVAATDSGATIAPNVPVNLYIRSVGYRYDQSREYYSTIKVNDQAVTGYWWELGSSFMVIRLNEFTGTFDFKSFDVANFNPSVGRAQADSMTNFINQTPVGNYIAFSIIFDGATNVTESLKVALERLGSTQARVVVAGQSWAFIGRKGNGVPGMTALESLTNDTAVVTLQVPNYYSFGNGSLTTMGMPLASSWDSFHWRSGGPATTNPRVALLGVRESGAVDTLRIIPRDSSDISLAFLNSVMSGAKYVSLQTAALLSSSDALVTPVLRDWWMDFVPAPDLAISARTVGGVTNPQTPRNIEVTLYNIGYATSDSSTVILSVYDRQNRARQIASVPAAPVAVGASRTVMIPISTSNLSRYTTVQARVVPAKTAKDLVALNNTAYYTFFTNTAVAANDVQVYANGIRLMDGDYVPSTPQLTLRIEKDDESVQTQAKLYVDNRLVPGSPDPVRDRKDG